MPTQLTLSQAEQKELLEQAEAAAKEASHLMRVNLNTPGKLMDALKYCSALISKLRANSLQPSYYNRLYVTVSTSLERMTQYLQDHHPPNQLADLYELVQYAGNVVPRLYLMVTVGSVYMGAKDAPVKEIMKDMMDMSRGIQHPVRSLFLRYYLFTQTKNLLPTGDSEGMEGNLQDSITFILSNFVEMNKLWVRFRYQAHSQETGQRAVERNDLKNLIGANLAWLNRLVDLKNYKIVLPSILEQVVHCRDALAQEYLLEVLTQAFPDEFHIETLDLLLPTLGKLQKEVAIKKIIVDLMTQLSRVASKLSTQSSADDLFKSDTAVADQLGSMKISGSDNMDPPNDSPWSDEDDSKPKGPSSKSMITAGEEAKSSTGAANIPLFDIFYDYITNLKAELLSISDLVALLESLANLALTVYPNRIDYIDKVLAFACTKVKHFAGSPDLDSEETQTNITNLIMLPFHSHHSIFKVLALSNLVPLVQAQPQSARVSAATKIADRILSTRTKIRSPSELDATLAILGILIEESGSTLSPQLPRIVHLVAGLTNDDQLKLLQTTRVAYSKSDGAIRSTTPALVTAFLRLARSYKFRDFGAGLYKSKAKPVFDEVYAVISALWEVADGNRELAFRLANSSAQVADQLDLPDVTFKFFSTAMEMYGSDIRGIRGTDGALSALCIIINSLHNSRSLSNDDYDLIRTKIDNCPRQLLSSQNQSFADLLVSHLWWPTEIQEYGSGEITTPDVDTDEAARIERRKNETRVLERLQRAAHACMDSIDKHSSVKSLVEILDRYVYYIDQGSTTISVRFVRILAEEIDKKFMDIQRTAAKSVLPADVGLTLGHFRRTLEYIEAQKYPDLAKLPVKIGFSEGGIRNPLTKLTLNS